MFLAHQSFLGDAYAHEAITPGDTVKSCTSTNLVNSVKQPCIAMTISITGNDILYTIDGTAPAQASTTTGHVGAKDTVFNIGGTGNITRFKCIDKVSGSAGVAHITYYVGV
jgi:hypothetical protein